MAKLLKCKRYLKEYGRSILTGSVIILTATILAGTIHHFLALFVLLSLLFLLIYIIWEVI